MRLLISAQEATGVTIGTPLGITANPWIERPHIIATLDESAAIRAAGVNYKLLRTFEFPTADEVLGAA